MRLQILSDLHLETEAFEPAPAPDAELLVLAGDIDSTWRGIERFARWPVPIVFVAGNHEFDARDLADAQRSLASNCESLGISFLERSSRVMQGRDGARIRFLGTTRWTDFDLFGAARRSKALRSGEYFQRLMRATVGGAPFDAEAVRREGLACRAWLERELHAPGDGTWDRTVVVTHFAPSARSADPRYGLQAATASFCNADDELLACADLWVHGHLHCRHDYRVERPDGTAMRVVCNARGHVRRGEAEGYEPLLTVDV